PLAVGDAGGRHLGAEGGDVLGGGEVGTGDLVGGRVEEGRARDALGGGADRCQHGTVDTREGGVGVQPRLGLPRPGGRRGGVDGVGVGHHPARGGGHGRLPARWPAVVCAWSAAGFPYLAVGWVIGGPSASVASVNDWSDRSYQ